MAALRLRRKCLGVGKQFVAAVLGPRGIQGRPNSMGSKADRRRRGLSGADPALADDALLAANWPWRVSEKPRFEVDGRFERAVRIAREHGLSTQQLVAVYHWAWTSYF